MHLSMNEGSAANERRKKKKSERERERERETKTLSQETQSSGSRAKGSSVGAAAQRINPGQAVRSGPERSSGGGCMVELSMGLPVSTC